MVPLSAEVAAWGAAGTDQTERLLSLVTGGDDYQTLTTVAPTHVAAYLEQAAHFGVKITPIGAVTKGAEIVLYHQGRAIALPHAKGWHI
jgi:thiamine-monophosphate kinase